MSSTVADAADASTVTEPVLAADRDPAADEYTVYPALVDDADRLTTWLTVDADVVRDLDAWR